MEKLNYKDIVKEMIEDLEYHQSILAQAREEIQLCLDNDKVGSMLYKHAIFKVKTAKKCIARTQAEYDKFMLDNS
jgi:hypothetical protein